MVPPGLTFRLGLSQLVCWGVSYYLIGVFGEAIAKEFGWSLTLTYSGFSGALVVMGLTSGLVGRMIDRHGGRRIMTLGSLLMAAGCLGLASAQGLVLYDLSWAVLGVAMRMTLYEAAFASLARIGGAAARRPISQVTLLGGLASTVFWPIGHMLADAFGWRGALVVFAAFALATVPLHWSIPIGRFDPGPADAQAFVPVARGRGERLVAASLYMVLVTATAFLNAGMSAHMIGIMSGLGMAAGLAIWLSTLRGIGQSCARLGEVVFGRNLDPFALGVIATTLLPFCFLVGLFSGASALAGAAFALAYGAGNGLVTIVRGAQPLALFDHRTYGVVVGRLTAPSFFLSALAPIAYASLMERAGGGAALYLSAALGALSLGCAFALWHRFGTARRTLRS
jgi:MFS family permease